jgi:outer membrane immunogenic protein
MNLSAPLRTFGAAVALTGALAAPALAAPSATISIHGGSAALLVGGRWGSGTLRYHGRQYALQVGGLSVGAIGVSSYSLSGEVYNLRRVGDIEGTYAALDASATAGRGAGVLDMKNGNGVEIRATSTSSGLKLSLAPSGVVIQLKH